MGFVPKMAEISHGAHDYPEKSTKNGFLRRRSVIVLQHETICLGARLVQTLICPNAKGNGFCAKNGGDITWRA
jgi:hypothetical protein